jgi:hypothetical protein
MPEKTLDGDSAGVRFFVGFDWAAVPLPLVVVKQPAGLDWWFVRVEGTRGRGRYALRALRLRPFPLGLGHLLLHNDNFTESTADSASICIR